MDARCPGLMIGWSRGAEGVLTLASTEQGPKTGAKAAVVYYPSVRGQEQPWQQRIPVLALQGTSDQIAPAGNLLKLVESRQGNGAIFDVHLYDGAHHRFDVAHPVDDPAGKAPRDHDAKASAEALAEIGAFLEMQGIKTGGCALDLQKLAQIPPDSSERGCPFVWSEANQDAARMFDDRTLDH